MSEVTEILRAIDHGDPQASDRLLPLVYEELRRLAVAWLAREAPGQTLQPTALVHEAYLRLVDRDEVVAWENERHFFAAAAEAMRRILVERARRRSSVKHGGEFRRVNMNRLTSADDGRTAELLAVDEALTDLEHHDSLAAQLVKLRYFAGLSHQDAARAMKLSRRTADRLWALAKAWLYQRMTLD